MNIINPYLYTSRRTQNVKQKMPDFCSMIFSVIAIPANFCQSPVFLGRNFRIANPTSRIGFGSDCCAFVGTRIVAQTDLIFSNLNAGKSNFFTSSNPDKQPILVRYGKTHLGNRVWVGHR